MPSYMCLRSLQRLSTTAIGQFVVPFVGRARATDIQAVIIGGQIVYQDGAFPHLDEESILKEISDQLAGPVPKATTERRRLAAELEPHLRRYYAEWDFPAVPLYRYQSIQ